MALAVRGRAARPRASESGEGRKGRRPEPRQSKFPRKDDGASSLGVSERSSEGGGQDPKPASPFVAKPLPAEYGEEYVREGEGTKSPKSPFEAGTASRSPTPFEEDVQGERQRANNPGMGLRIELPSLPSFGQIVVILSFGLIIVSMLAIFALTLRTGAISFNEE